VAAGALLAEEALTAVNVAGRTLDRGNGSEIAEVSDNLKDAVVRRACTLWRHIGAGDAFADGVEQPLVGDAPGKQRDQVRTAVAAGVEAMAIGALDPIQRHAGPD